MTPERMQLAYELFEQVLQHPADQRAAFLAKSCQDDAELRAEVESLLAHDGQLTDEFMQPPEPDPASTRFDAMERPDALIGSQVGNFHIKSLIASGGMGTVYEAVQERPHRIVALKIIKLGMDTREVIARFESERQALALMNHPNVAKVFDAGATEQGRPYFVMEYVPGVPITAHCDRHKLDIEQRLKLFMLVCDAVQHAHQKGIIHRDLKPSNILVAYEDKQAVPKIIDFGVAKAINQRLNERTIFTLQGQLIGTPEYMSPEQAEMSGQDIDTRADVYSLGVLLYELLTGTLPFDSETLRRAAFTEIQRIIREVEPPKPSTRVSSLQSEPEAQARESSSTGEVARKRRSDPRTLIRNLRGDLDWIAIRCLEKDRARRYETASALAADIRRHLNHEPVAAGPPSTVYRVRKFARRNRAAVIAASVVLIALLVGIAGTSWGLVQATTARDAERTAREDAQAALALAEQREREAITAREQEAEARGLAERREQEAREARDSLRIVVDFQQSALGNVSAEQMGQAIITDLRRCIRNSLEYGDTPPEQVDTLIAAFDDLVKPINMTDAALRVIDEQVLARAAAVIESDFADQPRVEVGLYNAVGTTYLKLGLYSKARPLLERALEVSRRELGADDMDTLIALNNMGYLLQVTGVYDQAEVHYREALEHGRRVLGDDHPETLAFINNLGWVLDSMGKLPEAEVYYREALQRKRRVLGDEHVDTFTTLDNLAVLLRKMGRYTEAERYCREALEGRRRILGDSPDTLNSLNNLAMLLESKEAYEEAESCYREVLEGSRRLLGDDHADTLASIANLGNVLLSMHRPAEAEPYCREALERRRRVLGADHPDTLTSSNIVGMLLRAQGRLQEAESYLRNALDGRRRRLGNDHSSTLISAMNMGTLLNDLGQSAEAEPYYREALTGFRRTLGADHRYTLQAVSNLGYLLKTMGRYEEAEPHYREALETRRRVLGDTHRGTLISVHNLGSLLRELGQFEEAEVLGAEAARGARERLSLSDPLRPAILDRHGRTLWALKRFTEAEAELLAAYEGYVELRGPDARRTGGVIEALVALHTDWHAAEPGAGYDLKAAEWRAKLEQWRATTQPAASQPASSGAGQGMAVCQGVTAPLAGQEGRQHQVREGRQR
ncbi:MAG: serine/threonine-protein kinase [Planctomycetota bacterium]